MPQTASEVYLVVVVLNPTEKDVFDNGAAPTIVVQPTAVMAADERSAAMKAARLVPTEYTGQEDRLEVRVLPFRLARQ